MTTKGNRYNDEFRADIIRLIREEQQPVNKIAKDFGVNDQTIRCESQEVFSQVW